MVMPWEKNWGEDSTVAEAEPTSFDERTERDFQRAYRSVVNQRDNMNMPLGADPDDPAHLYDYRAAYKAGDLYIDSEGHFPSPYKMDAHPRKEVGGIDTRTGEQLDKPWKKNWKETEDQAQKPWEKEYQVPVTPEDIEKAEFVVPEGPVQIPGADQPIEDIMKPVEVDPDIVSNIPRMTEPERPGAINLIDTAIPGPKGPETAGQVGRLGASVAKGGLALPGGVGGGLQLAGHEIERIGKEELGVVDPGKLEEGIPEGVEVFKSRRPPGGRALPDVYKDPNSGIYRTEKGSILNPNILSQAYGITLNPKEGTAQREALKRGAELGAVSKLVSENLKTSGEFLSEYTNENRKLLEQYAPSKRFMVNGKPNWDLLLDPGFISETLLESVTSMSQAVAAGGPAAAPFTGALMEAGPYYDELLKRGDPQATEKAVAFGLIVAAMEKIGFDALFKKAPPGGMRKAMQVLTSSITEGTTESLENPMQTMTDILNRQDIEWSDKGKQFIEAWKEGVNEGLGGLLGGGAVSIGTQLQKQSIENIKNEIVKKVEEIEPEAPAVEPEPEAPVVESEPEVEPTADEVKDDVKVEQESGETVVSGDVTPAEEKTITPVEQKKFLVKEITAAIEAAEWISIEDARKQKKDPGTVRIEVPGDGEFTLVNTKENLRSFAKRAKGFPTRVPGPGKTTKAPTRPTALSKLPDKRPSARAELNKILAPAVSKDATRIELQTVYHDAKSGELLSSDGKRIHVVLGVGGETKGQGVKPAINKPIPGYKLGDMPKPGPEYKAQEIDTEVMERFTNRAEALRKGVDMPKQELMIDLVVMPDGSVAAGGAIKDIGRFESDEVAKGTTLNKYVNYQLRDAFQFLRRMGNEKVTLYRKEGVDDVTKRPFPVLLAGENEYVLLSPVRTDKGQDVTTLFKRGRIKTKPAPAPVQEKEIVEEPGVTFSGKVPASLKSWAIQNSNKIADVAEEAPDGYSLFLTEGYIDSESGIRELRESSIKKLQARFKEYVVSTEEYEKVTEPKDTGKALPSAEYTVPHHKQIRERIQDGDITAEELKREFQKYQAAEESIKAHLETKTLKQLAPGGTGGLKKAQVINRIYQRMGGIYSLDKAISYSPFGADAKTYDQAQAEVVGTITDADIKQYAEKVQVSTEEHRKALTNPETLREFETFVYYKGPQALSPEQKTKYDELQAQETMKRRESEKDRATKITQVALENTKFVLSDEVHSKTGEPIYVVRLSDRVEKDQYGELRRAAKALGGYYSRYSRGFLFNERGHAEKFMTVKEKDLSTASERAGKKQEAQSNAVGRLMNIAERMEQQANNILTGERQTNTAKRAREAAYADERARRDLQLAETIKRVAGGVEAGEAPYLAGIRARTHIENLEKILYKAHWENIKQKHGGGTGIPKEYQDTEPSDQDIDIVDFPQIEVSVPRLRNALEEIGEDKSGFKRIVKKLLPKLRKMSDQDQYTYQAKTRQEENDIRKVIKSGEKAGASKWTIEDLKESIAPYDRLRAMGIETSAELRSALREYMNYRGVKTVEDPIKAAERELVGTKIPGFFPTPGTIIKTMIDDADIDAGMDVLEPSAGKGDIADMITTDLPAVGVDVVEINSTLRDILEEKGHEVVEFDFLDMKPSDKQYDRIVMNPPFEQGQDMEHVQHAYKMLKPGGRVVSIMSKGPFFRKDKKSVAFREWLKKVDGEVEDLDAGSFTGAEAFRQTGVSTAKVIIDKPEKLSGDEIAATYERATLPRRIADIEPHFDKKTGRPLSLADTRRYLVEALDIPYRVGVNRKRALGYYQPSTEVIRTRMINDVPTLAHEVGHYLHHILFDETTFQTKFDNELLKLGQVTSLPSYKRPKVRREGVAEFTRLYLTDPARAAAEAPMFDEYFQERLHDDFPVINKVLQEAQEMVKKYIEQPGPAKISSMIVPSGQRPKKSVSEIINNFQDAWVNELAPIDRSMDYLASMGLPRKTADKVSALAVNYVGGWRGKVDYALHKGSINLKGEEVGESLSQILEDVEDMDDFRAYLVANRAQELRGRGIQTGIDPRDANETVELFKAKYEPLRVRLSNFQATQRNLLVQAGVLSKKEAHGMDELNQMYVPFYRMYEAVAGRSMPGTGRGFVNTGRGIYKMKGSDREIIDPIESIIRNAYVFRDLADRNVVARSFINAVEKTPGGARVADRVVTKIKPEIISADELADIIKSSGVAQQLAEDWGMEDLALVNSDFDNPISEWLRKNSTGAKIWRAIDSVRPKDGIFKTWDKGRPDYYQLQDRELWRALNLQDSVDAEIMKKIPFAKVLNLATRMKRAGATLTLEFAARNPFRDQVTAAVYSEHGIIPFWDGFKAFHDVLGKTDKYWDWVKAGGRYSDMMAADRTNLEQALSDVIRDQSVLRKALHMANPLNALETLQKVSATMEEITRVAEYKAAIAKGKTPLEAANASKDVTLNFAQGGYKGRIVNKFKAFFNAGILDVDKMIRAHKKHPFRTALRAFLYITIPSIATWWLGKDDDDIQNLPVFKRLYFWNINLTEEYRSAGLIGPNEKMIISLPKPFLLGQIYGTSAEQALNLIYKDDPKAVNKFFQGVSGALPIDIMGGPEKLVAEMAPDLVQPLAENFFNYSVFRETPIVPGSIQGRQEQFQHTARTSQTAKLLSKKLAEADIKYSPMKIDNLVRGYYAGLGRYGLDLTDKAMIASSLIDVPPPPSKPLYELPGFRTFVHPSFMPGKYVDSFYKSHDEVEKLITSAKLMAKDKIPFQDNQKWFDKHKNRLAWYSARGRSGVKNAKALRMSRRELSKLSAAGRIVEQSRDLSPDEKRRRLLILKERRDWIAEQAYTQLIHPEDR